MNNFLVIHRPSNLIVNVFEEDKPDKIAEHHVLIPVSRLVLERYWSLLHKHRDGTCVDAGEFAMKSPAFLEALKTATL